MGYSTLDKFDWPYRYALERAVKEILSRDNFGHPFGHSIDVWNNALLIFDGESKSMGSGFCKRPSVDMEVVFAACMLHDAGYTIFDPSDPKQLRHMNRSAELAGDLLLEAGFPKEKIPDTIDAILLHDDTKPWGSFKKNDKLEVWYVQDADNLEALGPRGVARILDYDRRTGKPFYVAELKFDDPNARTQSSLHNVYAHIDVVKHLHTETARKLAVQKVDYMKKYIKDQLAIYRPGLRLFDL